MCSKTAFISVLADSVDLDRSLPSSLAQKATEFPSQRAEQKISQTSSQNGRGIDLTESQVHDRWYFDELTR